MYSSYFQSNYVIERKILKARGKGKVIKKIARELGIGVGTVQWVLAA